MSVQPKEENEQFSTQEQSNNFDKKVNLNDLMARMQETKKQEKKIISYFQQLQFRQ